MRFLYVMDPLERLAFDKDTTVAFLRSAEGRGHVGLHCEPKDLFVKDNDLFVHARQVVMSSGAPYATLLERCTVRVAEIDAVFIRKDPPFDAMYLMTTLLLERVRGRTVLVNDPRGLRDANEKLYALHFARWMPHTIVTSDEATIFSFLEEIGGSGVIKPLDLAGGSGVMMLRSSDKNARAIVQLLSDEGRRFVMVQKFLPEVERGDKRVLVLGGNILGAINRVPRADDLRSNIHVGGSVEPCEVTSHERELVRDLAPRLLADGLVFVGLDIIGGHLTEVNVTSPTGIQQMSAHHGRDLSSDVIAWVERAAEALSPVTKSMPPRP